MNLKEKNVCRVLFKCICTFGAISSSLWCCYEYSKNEDICEVQYKEFLEDEDSVYPDITVMIPQQSNETALKLKFDEKMNSSIFRKILLGEMWDSRILDVPLEEVSLDSDNYIISNCYWSTPYPPCVGKLETFTMAQFGMTTHTFRFPRTFKIQYAAFQFSTSVFHNGYSPNYYDLIIEFEYPNRLYRSQASFFSPQWILENGTVPKHRRLTYRLKNMEVLRRRHKRGKDCVDTEDFDSKIREDIMLEVGCRPHYYISSKIERVCSTREEYNAIITKQDAVFYKQKKSTPPCLEIQKLQVEESMKAVDLSWNEELLNLRKHDYNTEEIIDPSTEHSKKNGTWFEVKVQFLTDTFKEIKQKRAYTTQNLIGNLGGYIGIFLGFTLIDFLNLLILLCKKDVLWGNENSICTILLKRIK